ncbi:MAG: DUF998 domain-containing protein [Nitrososphaerota archaeon]|nr:DUF998 domain-containing protein [Nitrososphaerota archaeon]MDG7013950.1 DUF998 domain-containing protein [Nitrososphaerota archaeon]MDG7025293.1 DUF998 domain-containing protein [Nitrososphaerota archaeon]
MSNASKAGISIFLGSAQFSIFLVLAEILFPNYNVSTNYISDLGAFCPSTGPCVIEPSADVFNGSIILLGLLILLGAYYLQRAFRSTPTAAIVALAGVGAMGVGLFPETTGIWHSVFSLIVFLFAGLAAVLTSRYQKRPMSYFSIALGLITLAALVLFVGKEYLGLGAGGMERIVVYPVLIWSLGFGGHMMSTDDPARP